MGKIRYIVIASAFLLILSTVLFLIVPTGARFENVPRRGTVYGTSYEAPKSNCLSKEGGTVDLGNSYGGNDISIPVSVKAPSGKVSGKISCTLDSEAENYIFVTTQGLDSEENLNLNSGETSEFHINVMVDSVKVAELSTVLEVFVKVSYNYTVGAESGVLYANFNIRLCPTNYTPESAVYPTDIKTETIFVSDRCKAITKDIYLLQYRLPTGCSMATLKLGNELFPKHVKYMTSAGFTVLNEGGSIQLTASEGALLVDLSGTIYKEQSCTFVIQTTDGMVSFRDTVQLARGMENASFSINPEEEAILSDKAPLTCKLRQSAGLGIFGWAFSLERLTEAGWKEISWEESGIAHTFSGGEGAEATVILKADRSKAKAGTYRMKTKCTCQDICIDEKITTFFIDYR